MTYNLPQLYLLKLGKAALFLLDPFGDAVMWAQLGHSVFVWNVLLFSFALLQPSN